MNTTAHHVAAEEVMALLDGELTDERAETVSAHLKVCGECEELAGRFRSTSDNLQAWKVSIPPPLQKASALTAERKPSFHWPISVATRWGLVICAGVIAVGLLFSLVRSPKDHVGDSVLLQADKSKTVVAPRNVSPPVSAQSQHVNESEAWVSNSQDSKSTFGAYLSEQYLNKVPPPPAAAAQGGTRTSTGFGSGNGKASGPEQAPMIARTVTVSLVAKEFGTARASLEGILARHHGYAAQLTVNTAENSPRSIQASLRIPAGELAAAIADLRGLGRVENETQAGEEVTQQHADLVARLKNSRETELRLQAILAQRTGKMSDVLEVEQEIARVRGEIEQMEAELKGLEHRVDFATINLQILEEYKAQLGAPAASVSNRIHNAFVAGYKDASETLLGILLFFVEVGPTAVLWLAILFVPGWLVWRRFRRALAAA